MADTPVQLENIPYRRLFPWLHLTRAFWIAADIRKLVLAGLALMLISGGSLLFDRLPFGAPTTGKDIVQRDAQRWPWHWWLRRGSRRSRRPDRGDAQRLVAEGSSSHSASARRAWSSEAGV